MTANTVLVITKMLEILVIFLLRQNIINYKSRLNEFRNLMRRTDKTKIKKKNVHKNATNLYNTLLAIYPNEYNNIIDEKRRDR